ncbi:MAG: DUF4956 domain-containing protein [Anaerolineales bacterium]|nr:DUF4956 domain-containing protein [Anaerolineales bacterium]
MNGLNDFLIALGLNLVTSIIIVRWIYYPKHRSKKYVFTFLAFTLIIFLVVSMMTSVEMSIGVGFGLFAIFSVLRYRTNPIPIREMTYLFIIAALPVMNGSAATADHWAKLLIGNLAVIIILFILENEWGFAFESSKIITYEKINLIRPENHGLLLEDLEERTGLIIKRLEIGKINFLRDTAIIRVYYDNSEQPNRLQIPEEKTKPENKQDFLFTD